MSDKKYLNSILDSIQDREHVHEVYLSVGLAVAVVTYWGFRHRYERIRSAVDKNFKKCTAGAFTPKGEKYKKCMLQSKLGGQMKVLQLLNAVGPAKCKTKRDPRKCMEKLKHNRATLQAKIKVTQAKLSLIK